MRFTRRLHGGREHRTIASSEQEAALTLDSTHEFAPAGFDINKAGTRLPKIAILDRWTRIPRANPLLAVSGVVDTCSISTGDSWTEGTRGILRFQRKNVAFLKEPGGISRIPRNGIIKTPSSMQFPGISETVSTGLNSGYKKTTNPLCLQFIGIVPFEITGYKII